MKQLRYGSSAITLRLEYPREWKVEDITEVTVAIADRAGTELLAATAITPWSSVGIQTSADASVFEISTPLEVSATGSVPDLAPGDRIRIGDSADGPAEDIEVLSYDTTIDTPTFIRGLLYDHSDGSPVYGMFGTYDLDASDTDVWIPGKQVVITWTPDTDDSLIVEMAEVSVSEYAIPDEERIFATLYPREYRALIEPEPRFAKIMDEAHHQVRHEMLVRGMDVDRVADTRLLRPTIMAKARWLVLLDGDDQSENERVVAIEEYQRQLELLSRTPIWSDNNQDGALGDSEIDDHAQSLGFERGL